MAERSKGGMSTSDGTSSARTRPRAWVSSTSSLGNDGVWASTISRALSTGITASPSCSILTGRASAGFRRTCPPATFDANAVPGPRATGIRSVVREARLVPTVAWDDGAVVMIDQRRLPGEQVFLRCRQPGEVAEAIRSMAIRGAPAIGVAAALGLALAARGSQAEGAALAAEFERTCAELAGTRPTAVNLFWAIDRMRRRFQVSAGMDAKALRQALLEEALAIQAEDLAACRRMGDLGAALLPQEARILTHCNAGALATAGYGTALGVVRSVFEQGKGQMVFADETRPFLQGSRLTAWECVRDGIPHRLVADVVAASLMGRGQVDLVVTGADRIAANGDTANKIGTYALAVLAHHHHVPFYVAAPFSTIDPTLASGAEIPIEERDPAEVRRVGATVTAPEASPVFNPAFDVTPSELIAAIITERCAYRASYSFRR